MKQPRSYECVANEWIDIGAYGKERTLTSRGHYGERMYVGNNRQLFSYGVHFEIGRVLANRKGEAHTILLNGERASVTTNRHQGFARAAAARCGLPSVIIPYGALEAARIDIDTIRVLDTWPDRQVFTDHQSAKPPRSHDWVSGAEYAQCEWTDEEMTLWHEWAAADRHEKEIYSALARLRWSREGSTAAWGTVESNEARVRELRESAPDPIPLTEYVTRPPQKLVPTGRNVEGWVDGYHRATGVDADGLKVSGIRAETDWRHPDDDGVWRWTTSRHVLGESLIVADVNTTRRVKCPDCDGQGWDTTHKQPRLPGTMCWTGHSDQEDWSDLIVREQIMVPVPHTNLNVYQYQHESDPVRRERRISREYQHGRGWRTWTRPVLGALPMGPGAYACYGCHGAKTVRQNIKRRNVKFLSGFDANEPQLAYFFCELPKCGAETMEDAYESLKPETVKIAEAMGREVRRQGDIFAIPTSISTRELMSQAKRYGRRNPNVPGRMMHTSPEAIENEYTADDRHAHNWVSVPGFKEQIQASMLLGTNHQGTEVIQAKDGTLYARGCLWHVPDGRTNDHIRVNLGKAWHIIVKNTVPVVKQR